MQRPLEEFENPKQLVQVLSDTFDAHCQAVEKCGVLHLDVSVNNIMVDSGGRNVLIDWELAKRIGKPGGKRPELPLGIRRHAHLTGTWYFMSSDLLSIFGKEHSYYTGRHIIIFGCSFLSACTMFTTITNACGLDCTIRLR